MVRFRWGNITALFFGGTELAGKKYSAADEAQDGLLLRDPVLDSRDPGTQTRRSTTSTLGITFDNFCSLFLAIFTFAFTLMTRFSSRVDWLAEAAGKAVIWRRKVTSGGNLLLASACSLRRAFERVNRNNLLLESFKREIFSQL